MTMGIFEIIAASSQNKPKSTSPSSRAKEFKGVDRRKGGARSAFSCGLTFKTALAVAPIENWLKDQFEGEYRLDFQGMSDDLTVKQIRVAFSMPFQRDAFKEFLRGHHD